jgi:hypothetical protein
MDMIHLLMGEVGLIARQAGVPGAGLISASMDVMKPVHEAIMARGRPYDGSTVIGKLLRADDNWALDIFERHDRLKQQGL